MLLSAAIDGMFLNTELFGHQRGSSNIGYKKIKKETLVLSTQNLHLGNANVNMRFEHGIVSPAYKTYNIKNCSIVLFSKWIKSDKAKRFFYNATTVGASVCRRNVEWETLYSQLIKLPSMEEQQKIADFLALIDKRIDKQRQLVENLKKYKRGLLSAIFERKIRFKDDNGNNYLEWEKTPLGSIFNERTARADGNEELLAVTINEGIKKRNEIDLKDNSSDDKSNYKKVYIGDIAYNTMRMWQGASGVSKYNGIVSPAYTVIFPSSEIDIEFFGYYFKYIKVIQIFQKFSQGLTSDTWNLKFPQFAEINLYLPSINEQKRIAAFLKSFDNKILNEEAFLNNLTKKKRGLLQQMFI